MPKKNLNYESGQFEELEEDGFSVERGEYAQIWGDSAHRPEPPQEEFRFAEDDEEC